MNLFRRVRKVETPVKEMLCKCGYPIPPAPVTMREGFGYARVIQEYTATCVKCGKSNIYYG